MVLASGTCLFRVTVDSEKSFPTVTKQKECQGVNSDHSSKKGGEDGCQQDSGRGCRTWKWLWRKVTLAVGTWGEDTVLLPYPFSAPPRFEESVPGGARG